MIIFARGNYYKIKEGTDPAKSICAARWVKSSKKFSGNYYSFNVDKYVALTDEEAKAQGLI